MTERRSPITLALDCSNGGTAALAVNGALVAAAREACAVRCGERHPQHEWPGETDRASLAAWLEAAGFPPHRDRLPEHAIAACLTRGRLVPGDVERIVIVDATVGSEERSRRDATDRRADPDVAWIDPLRAGAWQLAAMSDGDTPMLIVRHDGRHTALFRWCHGVMTALDGPGIGDVTAAIAMVSRSLGGDGGFDAVERFSGRRDASAHPLFDEALTVDRGAIAVDRDRLSAILTGVTHNLQGPFGVRPEHQTLAAAFCRRAAIVLSTYVRSLLDQFAVQRIAFAGDVFASPGIRAILAAELGDAVTFAPFPESLGHVAGAALVGAYGTRTPLRTLALGPVVTEADVKATLDNCRLDYVYEPDWERLLRRTSRMLSRGNVVAWFNGSAPFGVQPDASRTTLCDPSKPYARENVNRFLRLGDVQDPLTVFLPADGAHEVVAAPVLSPLISHRATPRDAFRDSLRAALDQRGHVSVQIVNSDAPQLHRLLEVHRQETGVPGLIASSLGGDDGLTCSPRDAVRATFSSAVDALVIERFLVMKDWWLLRSAD